MSAGHYCIAAGHAATALLHFQQILDPRSRCPASLLTLRLAALLLAAGQLLTPDLGVPVATETMKHHKVWEEDSLARPLTHVQRWEAWPAVCPMSCPILESEPRSFSGCRAVMRLVRSMVDNSVQPGSGTRSLLKALQLGHHQLSNHQLVCQVLSIRDLGLTTPTGVPSWTPGHWGCPTHARRVFSLQAPGRPASWHARRRAPSCPACTMPGWTLGDLVLPSYGQAWSRPAGSSRRGAVPVQQALSGGSSCIAALWFCAFRRCCGSHRLQWSLEQRAGFEGTVCALSRASACAAAARLWREPEELCLALAPVEPCSRVCQHLLLCETTIAYKAVPSGCHA